jgi:O-antigen ligase
MQSSLILAYAIPLGIAALLGLLANVWAFAGRRVLLIALAAYLCLLILIPNASWGLTAQEDTRNFYGRGTGTFFFSAINVMLFGLFVQAAFARRSKDFRPVSHNQTWIAMGFLLLLFGNVYFSFAFEEVRWWEVIGYQALTNVLNLMLLFYVLTTAFQTRKQLEIAEWLFLVLVFGRGIWGLARFLFLGGDPANFYANYQRIDVKLTFFDINDSLLAMLALAIAAWKLLSAAPKQAWVRCFLLAVVLLETLIIIFSYRRTAWAGLLLALVALVFLQRRYNRFLLATAGIGALLPLLLFRFAERAELQLGTAGIFEILTPDLSTRGGFDFTTGRFSELYATVLAIRESPIWGLGLWGRYDGFRFSDLAWHGGNFTWMHSGVLHLALKSGLIGVILSTACIVSVLTFTARTFRRLPAGIQSLQVAGICGLAFLMPNWLIGTPVIEFRTMQLTAFVLALPYLAWYSGSLTNDVHSSADSKRGI